MHLAARKIYLALFGSTNGGTLRHDAQKTARMLDMEKDLSQLLDEMEPLRRPGTTDLRSGPPRWARLSRRFGVPLENGEELGEWVRRYHAGEFPRERAVAAILGLQRGKIAEAREIASGRVQRNEKRGSVSAWRWLHQVTKALSGDATPKKTARRRQRKIRSQ